MFLTRTYKYKQSAQTDLCGVMSHSLLARDAKLFGFHCTATQSGILIWYFCSSVRYTLLFRGIVIHELGSS